MTASPAQGPRRRRALSVFFPCYNEEGNVRRVVGEAMAFLPTVSDDFEVILVDDGSGDRTGAIADALAAADARIRVVHHETNRGYGGALQSGFRAATKELVFYTDGDGQFDFEEIDLLLPLLEEYDGVSAYRLNRRDPPIRKLNAWCWTVLVNLVFGTRLRDIDCAFKLFPRKLFDEIEMKSRGALIDAEVLARARRLGYRIGQVGVHHYPRRVGEQSGANLRVILRAFKELFKLRKEIKATGASRQATGNGR